MAWRDERPGERLRLPPQPAAAQSAGDRERFAPPVSVRCRERGASEVGRQSHSQDLESAGLTMVVTCAVLALLPRSHCRPRRPQRNSEDVVTPSEPPCFRGMGASLTKYARSALPPAICPI